jgi:Macrocin-O-methyltransferase (TylF)
MIPARWRIPAHRERTYVENGRTTVENLLDDQVKFLKGWFRDTLATAPVNQLALLRADGDLYESTRDSLVNLYPKVSQGGYVIIDDYNSWKGCRSAVDEYRKEHGITDEVRQIDAHAVFWQVSKTIRNS